MESLVQPVDQEQADIIAGWKYPAAYDLYTMHPSPALTRELLETPYYALLEKNVLIGYYCFGRAAQVPIPESGGSYDDESFLDYGLGMAPSFCGNGKGTAFAARGLAFAERQFGYSAFRLTVAAFNRRAVKVYERLGFRQTGGFTREKDSLYFLVMCKDD